MKFPAIDPPSSSIPPCASKICFNRLLCTLLTSSALSPEVFYTLVIGGPALVVVAAVVVAVVILSTNRDTESQLLSSPSHSLYIFILY